MILFSHEINLDKFLKFLVLFLKGILKQNKFTSEFLIKLVGITLFVLWSIKTGGADDLEEFDCIGKDEEVHEFSFFVTPTRLGSVYALLLDLFTKVTSEGSIFCPKFCLSWEISLLNNILNAIINLQCNACH